MGRPRKWKDDAERKRHERALDATQGPGRTPVLEAATPTPDPPEDGEGTWVELEQETVVWDGKVYPVVRTHPRLSEDAYVAVCVLSTKLDIAGGLKDPDGKRIERTKITARFRWRGWAAGEIRSL